MVARTASSKAAWPLGACEALAKKLGRAGRALLRVAGGPQAGVGAVLLVVAAHEVEVLVLLPLAAADGAVPVQTHRPHAAAR